MRLIDADALLEELAGDYNNLEGMPPDLEAAVYAIMDAPTEGKMVQGELWRAMAKLSDYYNKVKDKTYIRNPIAWALYQTWKIFDREG